MGPGVVLQLQELEGTKIVTTIPACILAHPCQMAINNHSNFKRDISKELKEWEG
jgi:hypothetical protein